jgi:hypothetical protein
MDRSIDPEAMYWPVGSNLAAKTSPEWPVSSITGDCSALLRAPYITYQHIAASAIVTSQIAGIATYRLNKRAISRSIHYRDCRAASRIRVRFCALHQLARAKGVLRRSFSGGHCNYGVFGGLREKDLFAESCDTFGVQVLELW